VSLAVGQAGFALIVNFSQDLVHLGIQVNWDVFGGPAEYADRSSRPKHAVATRHAQSVRKRLQTQIQFPVEKTERQATQMRRVCDPGELPISRQSEQHRMGWANALQGRGATEQP
jgi:hypothetical protein